MVSGFPVRMITKVTVERVIYFTTMAYMLYGYWHMEGYNKPGGCRITLGCTEYLNIAKFSLLVNTPQVHPDSVCALSDCWLLSPLQCRCRSPEGYPLPKLTLPKCFLQGHGSPWCRSVLRLRYFLYNSLPTRDEWK